MHAVQLEVDELADPRLSRNWQRMLSGYHACRATDMT
jgi:hypothetical protein